MPIALCHPITITANTTFSLQVFEKRRRVRVGNLLHSALAVLYINLDDTVWTHAR